MNESEIWKARATRLYNILDGIDMLDNTHLLTDREFRDAIRHHIKLRQDLAITNNKNILEWKHDI